MSASKVSLFHINFYWRSGRGGLRAAKCVMAMSFEVAFTATLSAFISSNSVVFEFKFNLRLTGSTEICLVVLVDVLTWALQLTAVWRFLTSLALRRIRFSVHLLYYINFDVLCHFSLLPHKRLIPLSWAWGVFLSSSIVPVSNFQLRMKFSMRWGERVSLYALYVSVSSFPLKGKFVLRRSEKLLFPSSCWSALYVNDTSKSKLDVPERCKSEILDCLSSETLWHVNKYSWN